MKKRTARTGFVAGLTILAATGCFAEDPMFEVSVIPGANPAAKSVEVNYVQQRGDEVWMLGSQKLPDGTRAVLRWHGTNAIPESLPWPTNEWAYCFPSGINGLGDAVGYCGRNNGNDYMPVLWPHSGGMVDLREKIPIVSHFPGSSPSIDDYGRIIANVRIGETATFVPLRLTSGDWSVEYVSMPPDLVGEYQNFSFVTDPLTGRFSTHVTSDVFYDFYDADPYYWREANGSIYKLYPTVNEPWYAFQGQAPRTAWYAEIFPGSPADGAQMVPTYATTMARVTLPSFIHSGGRKSFRTLPRCDVGKGQLLGSGSSPDGEGGIKPIWWNGIEWKDLLLRVTNPSQVTYTLSSANAVLTDGSILVLGYEGNDYNSGKVSIWTGNYCSYWLRPVAQTAPAIVSAPVIQGHAGLRYYHRIVSTGWPVPALSISNAPAWLTLSGMELSGIPEAGTFGPIQIIADNGTTRAVQNFILTIDAEPVPPAVTCFLSRLRVLCGLPASFFVEVTGTPTPTIQWERSDNGGATWSPIALATAPHYRIDYTAMIDNNAKFRVIATSPAGSATSSVATLEVRPPQNTVTTLSGIYDRRVLEGQSAIFFTEEYDPPQPPYTAPYFYWEKSADGINWTVIPGEVWNRYVTPPTTLADNGLWFRFWGNPHSVERLWVLPNAIAPVITNQPASVVAEIGQTVKFRTAADGVPAPTVRWERKVGDNWFVIADATSWTYTTPPLAPGDFGTQFRAVVGNMAGNATSETATVTLSPVPGFALQPADCPVEAGQSALFEVEVVGTPAPTLLWLCSRDGGLSWNVVPGATNRIITIASVSSSDNGALFQCVANSSIGVASSRCTKLTVLGATTTTLTISAGPGGTTTPNGTVAVLRNVAASIGATPNAGYHFNQWTVIGGAANLVNVSFTNTTATIAAPAAVRADFEANLVAILADTASVAVPEYGTASFGVRLSGQPAGDMLVTVARTDGDSDLSVTAGASLLFTPADWNRYQTVKLAAAGNTGPTNGAATFYCSAPGVAGVGVTAVETNGASQAGLRIVTSTTTLRVDEGSLAYLQVRLSEAPIVVTTVTVARVSGDSDISVLSGGNLVFTDGNWNVDRTVVLTAAKDADMDDGTAILTCTAAGVVGATVTVTKADSELLVTVTAGPGGSVTASKSSVLRDGPMSLWIEVTPAAGYTLANWSVKGGTAIFTRNPYYPERYLWDVTLSPDTPITGPMTIQAQFANSTPTILTTKSALPIPEGGTGFFQVKLSTMPATNTTVTVSRTSGDSDLTVFAGGTLTFTTNNWDVYQAVVLRAAEDGDTTNGTATFTCGADGVVGVTVTATEGDNDTTLTVTADVGGATTPSGDITVTKNEPFSLHAVANAGYTFSGWTMSSGSGTIASANADTIVTLAGPATIRADFTLIPDPEADDDQDGMRNLAESIAGTDPRDARSLLAITGIHSLPEGLRVDWKGGQLARQRIECRTNLTDTGEAWTPIHINDTIPTPPTNSFVLPWPPASTGFYRLKAER